MRPSAPPENMSNMPNMPPPCRFSISAITAASTPGTGMYVPNRYTTRAPRVNQIRLRSSVAFESVPKFRLEASCSAAEAMRRSFGQGIAGI
jgi:hypothetical protein